jgi:RNA polymerase sigma-70 factor (ECF subfamily)
MQIQGRHGDFERVMLPHLDAAYNLARWLVRDPSIAEDVVQDAYERACKYFAAFRGGSGRAWLLQIVRNVAYSTLKAQRRRMEVSLSSGMRAADEDVVDMDIPDSSPDPEATLAQRQELAALDDALNALPVAWRECLILREVEALSYKEMARIMDVPIGTVMSRLSRARQALQRGVGPQDVDRKNGKSMNMGSPTPVSSAETSARVLTTGLSTPGAPSSGSL